MSNPIPLKVLDQHIAALGKTGSGKSSALRVLVEMLLDHGKRVCIIDKKGDWYGIKLGADGRSAGYPFWAFGDFKNEQATDFRINETHGVEIARLILSGNRPCLIGFKGWMPGKMHKFWMDFASTVYNENKEPLWLVISEAHNFSPKGKVLSPVVGECIYWTNLIATEGRGIGLRLMIDSQRPAKVHNDLLSSCETLIAMRVTLPTDKDALAEWFREYGTDNARGKMVLDSVSTMKTGEAFVCSPEAELFQQLKFPMFKTFDSFASPKEGVQRTLKGWASVDRKDVEARLAKVIEETKQNDPAELKKRIRELEARLKAPQKEVDPDAIRKAVMKEQERVKAVHTKELNKVLATANRDHAQAMNRVKSHIKMLETIVSRLQARMKEAVDVLESNPLQIPDFKVPDVTTALPLIKETDTEHLPNKVRHDESISEDSELSKPQLTILIALGKFQTIGRNQVPRKLVAALAGVSHRSGSFANNLSFLRSHGFIEYCVGQAIMLKADGMKKLPHVEPPTTNEEMLNYCLKILSNPRGDILRFLYGEYPNYVSREETAQTVGVSSTSGSYANNLSALRSAGMIEYGQNKDLVCASWLFIE